MCCSSLLPNPTPQTSASPLCVLSRGSPDTHKLRRYRVLSTNGLLRLSESQGYDAPWWSELEASLPCPGEGEPACPRCWGSGCRTIQHGPALRPSHPQGSPPFPTRGLCFTEEAEDQGIGGQPAPGAVAPFIALLCALRRSPSPEVSVLCRHLIGCSSALPTPRPQ